MEAAVNWEDLLLPRLFLAESKQCLSRCFRKPADQHRIWIQSWTGERLVNKVEHDFCTICKKRVLITSS